MSSDAVISVRQLAKSYRIFGNPGDRIKQALSLGRVQYHRKFTALEDISFDILKGETVGIVGRNGSGKSTLLQLVCGILTPTSGLVKVNGRISALLELGAGFNPEFTGRENVYFQGAVMGLSKAEMEERFDDIVAFADIGQFIDQQVRTYSSGMFVRLAFAVANSLNPDILVVDEALAVGDEAFKRKCYARFREFTDHGGTLLFVSHSTNTIVDLCDRALLLDSGRLWVDGNPKTVVGWYQKLLYSPQAKRKDVLEQLSKAEVPADLVIPAPPGSLPVTASFDPNLLSDSVLNYESQGAIIQQPAIHSRDGEKVNILIAGQEYVLSYDVAFQAHAENVLFGMMVKTLAGVQLGGINRTHAGPSEPGKVEHVRLAFRCRLCRGTYFLNVGVFGSVNGHATYLHRILDALMFRVEGSRQEATGSVDLTLEDPAP